MFKIYGLLFEIICIVLIIWSTISSINDRKHPKKVKEVNEESSIMISIGKKKYICHKRVFKYGLFMVMFFPPLEGKMLIILEGIFIVLIIILPVSLVFCREPSEIVKEDNKNILRTFNDGKLGIIIVLCINVVSHVIDYLFNTDMISAFTYHKNGGMTISFIGIFILIATSILVIFIRKIIIEYLDKKKNQ